MSQEVVEEAVDVRGVTQRDGRCTHLDCCKKQRGESAGKEKEEHKLVNGYDAGVCQSLAPKPWY